MNDSANNETLIEAAAATIGLSIPPDARPGVAFDFERLRGMARLLMDHPLAATDEALPVLRYD